jgi:hypothetical protein
MGSIGNIVPALVRMSSSCSGHARDSVFTGSKSCFGAALCRQGYLLLVDGCVRQRCGRAMVFATSHLSRFSGQTIPRCCIRRAARQPLSDGTLPGHIHSLLASGRAHGPIDLENAIAQSCNTYFLELAAGLDRKRAEQTFARYGLAGPSADAGTESLVGLGAA